jgi:GT2 family glycosyltransferase
MTLSVVIVSYESAPELAACLTSLQAAVDEAQLALELVVVDNASTDRSVATVRELAPSATTIRNGANLGFARAVNQGLERTTGDLILLLNPDTVVNRSAIAACARRLDERAVGIVAPILVNDDGSRQRSWHEFPTLRRALIEALPPLAVLRAVRRRMTGPPRSPEWVIGAFMMTRRDVLDRVGGLDEGSFMYGEDMEWCWRIRRAGFQVELLRDVRITHAGGRSAGRHYRPMDRHLAVENATLGWMRGSRMYAAVRWLAATQEGLAIRIISAIVPGARTHLRRAIDRRAAARSTYAAALTGRRRGRSAGGPPDHR